MNVRLKFNLSFCAGIWFDNSLQMNNYVVELYLVTNTSNNEDHNVCLERIKYFLYKELESTVFIQQDDIVQIQALAAAGIKVTTLPEEPVDQIVGLVLYSKINTILENRMIVTALNLESELGDNVQYLHNSQEVENIVPDTGWWKDSGPGHSDIRHSPGKKKVVKINRTNAWKELDLAWAEDSTDQETNSNTVLFANFNKDED
jgi:hypothetical protein